jgi:hypothetical protein
MSKQEIRYSATDVGALAKALRTELSLRGVRVGHCEMLNLLARGAGFRNFQHYRAQALAQEQLEAGAPSPDPAVDYAWLRQQLRFFDAAGALARWPSKYSQQVPCLWVLWSRLPARVALSEREVNALLAANHRFGDHALLRRELVNHKLLARPNDCSSYRRIEQVPPPAALGLIRQLKAG